MKGAAKTIAQSFVTLLAPAIWRWRESCLLVLMYHRVLPADHPARTVEQPGMYVSPETLESHLRFLRGHFNCIHLDEWIERASRGHALPRRACAITFDDGWLDNYQYAYPLLEQYGTPATIYLVSDLVGTTYEFWPNVISRVVNEIVSGAECEYPEWVTRAVEQASRTGSLNRRSSVELADKIISDLKRDKSDFEMNELVAELRVSGSSQRRDLMNWTEIRELSASGLVRFGSHTRTHFRLLPGADSRRIKTEIIDSIEVLEAQIGYRPRTFCYPNGDYTTEALDLVRGSYIGAVTTSRGWNKPGNDLFRIRRIGVHEDVSASRTAFVGRLAGVG
jgi:peptidoglycan/xylan/chitin deacetylase (PgdA/CDA1 family)